MNLSTFFGKAKNSPKTVVTAGVAGIVAITGALFLGRGRNKSTDLPKAKNLKGFSPSMTRKEAEAIMMLSSDYKINELKKRHHELMIRHHPDKGGSSYIATKINEARDILQATR